MELKHLQYFMEIARFGSFSKAADQLFITQPTISKMIKNLKDELGTALFDRSAKRIVLTDAGKLLLEQAKIVSHSVEQLQTEMSNLLELKTGRIRIGLPPIFDAHVFLKATGLFHQQYPGITFQLQEHGSKSIEELIEQRDIDVGIVVLPTQDKRFHSFSFLTEDLMLVVPSSHPLARKSSVQIADLAEESFILFNKDFALHDRIVSFAAMSGFQPKIISESSQWSFIEEMVASQLGISLLPESICRHLHDHVQAVRLVDPPIQWELALIWSKHHALPRAAKEWLHFIKPYLTTDIH